LATLLEGVPSKINLIPFNPFPGIGYRRSSEADMFAFGEYLLKRGYVATIRKTRGEDIDAACGQLAGKVTDRSHRHLRFIEPRFGAMSGKF
jgi:23S rRNA (adenine2503-C2)-methyltransferase